MSLLEKNKKILYVIMLVMCAFGIGFVSRGFRDALNQSEVTFDTIREIGKYKLISPLLLCNGVSSQSITEYKSLEGKIANYIGLNNSNNSIEVGVYFRDLNLGKWFGINENARFAPASLLKVPLMIAYYRLAQTDPSILSQPLVYDGSFDDNAKQTFKSKYFIETPGQYTVEELIKAMIVNSDNNALRLLSQNINLIDPKIISEVYTDLGLSVPSDNSPDVDFMSAKIYSYFFRILYNGTYLNREYSEKALELLTGPDFPQGIKAGVPQNITVAQKFGDRVVDTPDGTIVSRELHDCGIVYAGQNPYLLCVMTKGSDLEGQTKLIQGISAMIYTNH